MARARVVTLPQAAKQLGISESTVTRWRKTGKIEATRDELAHWLIDLDKIPVELVRKTQALAKRRYPDKPDTVQKLERHSEASEIAWLRSEIERRDAEVERVHRILAGVLGRDVEASTG